MMNTRSLLLALCLAGLGFAGSAYGDAPTAKPTAQPSAPKLQPTSVPKAVTTTTSGGGVSPEDRAAAEAVIALLQQAKAKLQAQLPDAAGHRAKAIKAIDDAIAEVNLAVAPAAGKSGPPTAKTIDQAAATAVPKLPVPNSPKTEAPASTPSKK